MAISFERHVSKSSRDLDNSEAAQIKQSLVKHQNIFCKSSANIGHSTLIKHKIDTDHAKAVKNKYKIDTDHAKPVQTHMEFLSRNGK